MQGPPSSSGYVRPPVSQQQHSSVGHQANGAVYNHTIHSQTQHAATSHVQPQQQGTAQQSATMQQGEQYVDTKQLIHSIYQQGNVGYTECDEELLKISSDFQLLNDLIKYEGYIDKMVKRKRFDLQEQFARPANKMKQIFRMYISNNYQLVRQRNYADGQEGNSSMELENEVQQQLPQQPQLYEWGLKITGHLLQEDETNAALSVSQKQVFSNYFSKVIVDFDKNTGLQHEQVIWRKSDKVEQGILIKRQTTREIIVTLHIHLYHNPLKFKVDPRLAAVIGFDICSRSTALAAIWEYIKLKSLLDTENKSEVNCDDALRVAFQQDKISIGQITGKLRSLLTIPNPVQIRHQIKLSGTPEDSERVYDFLVEVDSQLGMEIMPFFSQKVVVQEKKDSQKHPFITLNSRLKDLEKKFSEQLEKIASHKFKRDSYLAYNLDPSIYIENTILQQNCYLQIMKEENEPMIEDPSSIDYLRDNEDLVEREIQRYLEAIDGAREEMELDAYQQEQNLQTTVAGSAVSASFNQENLQNVDKQLN